MTREEVKAIMQSSKSEQEWNSNADRVKQAFGGYPEFWYGDIILGGALAKSQYEHKWGEFAN